MVKPLIKVSRTTKLWIRRIRWFSIALIVVSSTLLYVVLPYNQHRRIQTLTNELVANYGLVVRYGDPAQFFIPPLEAIDGDKESHISFEPVDKELVPQVLEGVTEALKRYPPALIKKYLSAIFIVGKIKINEVEGAATFAHSWIYIAAPRWDGLGSVSYALSVHHEFSTFLFHGAQFPVIPWHLVNPSDFKYLEKYEDIIRAADLKNRKDPKSADQWYEAGFVSDYGMSDMENDFNTYAEIALAEPEKLRALADKYFLIKRKTDLLVKFYSQLAPEMCDYFKSVGLAGDCGI